MTYFQPPKCPECNNDMVLRRTEKYTTRDGKPRRFWGCPNFPWCRNTLGAHPSGRPMGFPGDRDTKHARVMLHNAFAEKFGPWDRMSKSKRDLMYTWMKMHAPQEHIAMMTKEECMETLTKVRKMI